MKIVLIGAGNVATHLGRKLVEVGEEVVQVFSRSLPKAAALATELGARPVDDLYGVTAKADLYIIAVHDDAIGEVLKKIEDFVLDKLVVHTSGSTPAKVFETVPELNRTGVFYPLQTFTKERQLDFSEVPICIQASQDADLLVLEELASKISSNVYKITDAQRAWLHVSAVFVNNFTNHLFNIGNSCLGKKQLPFEMLMPLIRETVAKLEDGSPKDMQTGPAVRKDIKTIERHLTLLNGRGDLQEIYRVLTKHIKRAHADNWKH
ncbi:MAG: DUF2520 domain-containing protein [Saprospiraceae bacterium]|nr:DUF2520 domain-containing protein [Saprospiraceae bacterium]MCF8248291.1 DUF2520 domain-containing protein [Saprospiraceae bacterium]MCF8279955.1 DUF2520 domain-containing protein [Bacteroidales bacterium]MCF8309819.1 DUF2520 domain-containing protein [Saprospiraceae bacterium]MCF8438850.1 DUF2520 domain-containing protein [Saprospiraceae bacterium]